MRIELLKIILLSASAFAMASGAEARTPERITNNKTTPVSALKYEKRVKIIKKSAYLERLRSLAAKSESIASKSVSILSSDECDEADCGGEVEIEELEFGWDYLSSDSGELLNAVIKLETVEVDGERSCTVEVSGSGGSSSASCDDVGEALDDSTEMSDSDKSVIEEIVDTYKEMVEPPEKLEKCANVVDPKDSKATLLTDKGKGYEAAERAFMGVYKDSLPAIHNFTPIDVKYPGGLSYTFQVFWIRFDPPSVELGNPVMVKSTETTCK